MTWQSSLELSFDYRVSSQKTRLCHRLHEGALMVQRPLYPEPEKIDIECPSPDQMSSLNSHQTLYTTPKKRISQSGICHIYVLYPPAGIADGDKLDMTFDLKPYSYAVITTPGAGKWYGQRESLRSINSPQSQLQSQQSLSNPIKSKPKAEQNIRVQLADNATLEWLPQESIYFDYSVSNACSHFDLAPTASLMTWDIAVFGRQAYNETFTNGQYNNRLQIWRDNQLLVSEHTQQVANSRWFQSPLGLNKQHVHGSFWAVPSVDVLDSEAQSNPLKLGQFLDETITELRELIDQHNLPIESTHNYQAINCRYIGGDVRACFEAFYEVRELLREKWYQLQPHRPRIWDT